MLGSASYSAWVWTGIIGAAFAIAAGFARLAAGVWKMARAIVHFVDAMPALLLLAERPDETAQLRADFSKLSDDFRRHAADDASFQSWIVRTLELKDPTKSEKEPSR